MLSEPKWRPGAHTRLIRSVGIVQLLLRHNLEARGEEESQKKKNHSKITTKQCEKEVN